MAKKPPHVDPHAADRFITGEPTPAPEPEQTALPLSKLDKPRDKRRMTVYLDPKVADAVEALARKTNRPVTSVVEIALRRLLGMPD